MQYLDEDEVMCRIIHAAMDDSAAALGIVALLNNPGVRETLCCFCERHDKFDRACPNPTAGVDGMCNFYKKSTSQVRKISRSDCQRIFRLLAEQENKIEEEKQKKVEQEKEVFIHLVLVEESG